MCVCVCVCVHACVCAHCACVLRVEGGNTHTHTTRTHSHTGVVSDPELPFNTMQERFDQRFACFHSPSLVRPAPYSFGECVYRCVCVCEFTLLPPPPPLYDPCDSALVANDAWLVPTPVLPAPRRTVLACVGPVSRGVSFGVSCPAAQSSSGVDPPNTHTHTHTHTHTPGTQPTLRRRRA